MGSSNREQSPGQHQSLATKSLQDATIPTTMDDKVIAYMIECEEAISRLVLFRSIHILISWYWTRMNDCPGKSGRRSSIRIVSHFTQIPCSWSCRYLPWKIHETISNINGSLARRVIGPARFVAEAQVCMVRKPTIYLILHHEPRKKISHGSPWRAPRCQRLHPHYITGGPLESNVLTIVVILRRVVSEQLTSISRVFSTGWHLENPPP